MTHYLLAHQRFMVNHYNPPLYPSPPSSSIDPMFILTAQINQDLDQLKINAKREEGTLT